MADRPGLIQKRISPHHFIQLPGGDRDKDTGRSRDKLGTSGAGAGAGADSSRERNDAAIVDTSRESPASRKYQLTGARKESSMSSVAAIAPFCHGAAYGPPFLFSNGIATEKTGLVDEYGTKTRRSKLTRRRSFTDDPDDIRHAPRTRLARIYTRVMGFSTVTRYAIYIVPLGAVIAIPIILGATAARTTEIGGVKLYWFFAWIEVVWLALWASKLVAHLIPGAVRFVGRIMSSPKTRHTRLLRTLEVPISLLCWGIIALLTFFPIMNLNPAKMAEGDTAVKSWQIPVKNLLFALLICSVMFLAEKTLIRALSLSYRRTQFEAKINECARIVEMLASLYGASRIMFPVYGREFRNDDAIMADSVRGADPAEGGRVLCKKPLKYFKGVSLLGEEMPVSRASGYEFNRHAFGWNSAQDAVIQALGRKKATEALARRIWMSFVVEGRYALYLEDIIEVLGWGREAEAQKCFKMLDRDGNGNVSLDEMILTVAEFGQMRTSLLYSLHDVDHAIHFLDIILATVAVILGTLVSVFFVTNTSTTAIAAGATALLGLCFLLSSTAHEVLGSCVLLFIKRPFDVGDRVEIDEKGFVVHRISLLYTVFRCVADNRTTQAANNVLNNHWIDNFTRANAIREQLTIPVNFDTTFADIQSLREEMERFVRDKDNCRDFMPNIEIEVAGMGDMDRLELRVDLRHQYNWSNESVRTARRSKFMCALVLALRKIGIRAPGADDELGPEKLFGPAGQYEEASGLPSGEVNDFSGPRSEQEPQTLIARHGRSHLNPRAPSPGDEETRYLTPSASPNKRLSANLNPGMSETSRQSSTGWRKATGSTERVTDGTRVITEPASLQSPSKHQGQSSNPYATYLSPHQRQRTYSFDAGQSQPPREMEQCTSSVAGLTVQPKANPW